MILVANSEICMKIYMQELDRPKIDKANIHSPYSKFILFAKRNKISIVFGLKSIEIPKSTKTTTNSDLDSISTLLETAYRIP